MMFLVPSAVWVPCLMVSFVAVMVTVIRWWAKR